MILTILAWIIFGALAGWIASMVIGNNKSQGALGNVIVGIAGALIGGFVVGLFGVDIDGFNAWNLIVAIGGAILLLAIFSGFRRSSSV
jgi:uncharacterized membrane protein YeaQ/YmgE (transglycosylase-associated protein family)